MSGKRRRRFFGHGLAIPRRIGGAKVYTQFGIMQNGVASTHFLGIALVTLIWRPFERKRLCRGIV